MCHVHELLAHQQTLWEWPSLSDMTPVQAVALHGNQARHSVPGGLSAPMRQAQKPQRLVALPQPTLTYTTPKRQRKRRVAGHFLPRALQ
mmetsp:Transcript_60703/g.169697  ORF Transcript_60703/g.169697 Transcript_60703/m.169697 type:complete len:89 (+) Transcript_60703:1006-1272(+)